MRLSVHIDSATTEELRDLLRSYYRATGRTDEVTVGLNGPECWTATTPPISGRQAWALVDHLADGKLLAGLVDEDFGTAPDPEPEPIPIRAAW